MKTGRLAMFFDNVEGIQAFFIVDFMTFVGAPHDRRYVIVQIQFVILKYQ